MSDTVITISMYNRLDFAVQTMKALFNCDGIEDYPIIISVDGKRDGGVIGFAEALTATSNVSLYVNHENMGCGPAIRESIRRGFGQADKVIHIEDDVCLAKDALTYFQTMLDRYEKQDNIKAITGFSRDPITSSNRDDYVIEDTWYPWGWATWIDRWHEIEEYWSNEWWDVSLKKSFKLRGHNVIRPIVSRTKHIGWHGTHVANKDQWEKKWNTADWMGDLDNYKPGTYQEVCDE